MDDANKLKRFWANFRPSTREDDERTASLSNPALIKLWRHSRYAQEPPDAGLTLQAEEPIRLNPDNKAAIWWAANEVAHNRLDMDKLPGNVVALTGEQSLSTPQTSLRWAAAAQVNWDASYVETLAKNIAESGELTVKALRAYDKAGSPYVDVEKLQAAAKGSKYVEQLNRQRSKYTAAVTNTSHRG